MTGTNLTPGQRLRIRGGDRRRRANDVRVLVARRSREWASRCRELHTGDLR